MIPLFFSFVKGYPQFFCKFFDKPFGKRGTIFLANIQKRAKSVFSDFAARSLWFQ